MTTKYSAPINSSSPTLIGILMDGSGSMQDVMPQSGMRKCDVVATLVNKTLQELSIGCSRDVIKHYYDIFACVYSGEKVSNAFAEIPALAENPVNSICDIVANPLRIEDRITKKMTPTGDLVDCAVQFPVWIGTPVASSGTPMAAGLQAVNDIVANWIAEHPNAHAPVVIHVTDGEATDANSEELERLASCIKSLETMDGQVILMNAHITADPNASAVNYAAREEDVSNPYAKLLWRMASEIPSEMVPAVSGVLGDGVVRPGSRFATFNADEVDVARFLKVGTDGTRPTSPDPNR